MSHWTDHLDPDGPDGAYLPWKKVEARVGISRTTAWRLQKAADFPKPYVMSPGRVAYRESEIEAWKASRGHRTGATPQPALKPAGKAKNPLPEVATEPPSWTPPAADPPSFVPGPAPPLEGAPQRERSRRQHASRSNGQMTFDF